MHGHGGVTLHSGVLFSALVSAVNPMRMLLLSSCLFVGGLAELVTAWLNGEIDITPAEIVDAATFQFTSTAHR